MRTKMVFYIKCLRQVTAFGVGGILLFGVILMVRIIIWMQWWYCRVGV